MAPPIDERPVGSFVRSLIARLFVLGGSATVMSFNSGLPRRRHDGRLLLRRGDSRMLRDDARMTGSPRRASLTEEAVEKFSQSFSAKVKKRRRGREGS